MRSLDGEPLEALCQFIRLASGADLVMALEIGTTAYALPVASAPAQDIHGFSLSASEILDRDWTAGPISADAIRLPTAVVDALGAQPAYLLFVPTPLLRSPRSGVLVLWVKASPPSEITGHLSLLATSVVTVLAARGEHARQGAIRDQFNDLFESVPSGIVLFDGDGREAIVNERAADLLGCTAGPHNASALTAPMRALRERCDNHAELERAYAAHVSNVHFAAALHWVLGDRTLEVDTHPVRGDGALGRIWLFTDVTAELLMAAELRRLATSDPLTGVSNRRHFEERSAQIIASRAASGRFVGLLMIDVDHFKQVNDRFGHPVGDVVLKTVARRCRDALRDRDLFARFGGEEFVALLSARTQDEVMTVAERLRRTIAEAPVRVETTLIDITISVGAVSRGPDDGDNKTLLTELVAQADAALYNAKQSGRNQVSVADGC